MLPYCLCEICFLVSVWNPFSLQTSLSNDPYNNLIDQKKVKFGLISLKTMYTVIIIFTYLEFFLSDCKKFCVDL